MDRVTIGAESESAAGWTYEVRVERAGVEREHRVHLAWVDHDHFSGGTRPPSEVIRSLLEALLDARPELELPSTFDASVIRRWAPGIRESLAHLRESESDDDGPIGR